MKNHDLDRILAREETILPSSGFAAFVMDAVQREAATPPPIPFPWKRAIPGIAAAAAVLVTAIQSYGYLVRTPFSDVVPTSLHLPVKQFLETAMHFGADWIALALFLSLASVVLSSRLSDTQR